MISAFKQIRLTNLGVSGSAGRINVNGSGLAYYSELTGTSGVLQTNINNLSSATGSYVQTGRTVNAGSGLAGGGTLNSDITLNVGQGYGISVSSDSIAVNTSEVAVLTGTQTIGGSKTFSSQILIPQASATGHAVAAARIISGGNGLTGGGDLTSDRTLNVGQGYGILVSADDVAVNTTDVVVTTGTQTIAGSKTFSNAVILSTQATSGTHAVAASRNIIAGSGLAGGGDLTSDKTINVGQGYGLIVSADDVAVNTAQVVVTTGVQTIAGNKFFTNSVYIQDLYVTGTQTIVNTQVTNVGSNYLNLNATGGARDGGLFINLSTGATPSGSGAYIGFDIPSNTFRIGTGVSGLNELGGLDIIATQAYVTAGFVPTSRNINAGSGLAGTSSLASDVTLNIGQGYGISVSADTVAVNTNEVVVLTGSQTIGGSKTFSSQVTVPQASATGHAVAAARIISGGSGLAGGGNLTSDVTLNIGQGYGISVSADAVAVNTAEVVVTTGAQTISGVKTFASRPLVNGTPVLLSGEASALPDTIVYTSGNQDISGIKNFLSGFTSPNFNVLPSTSSVGIFDSVLERYALNFKSATYFNLTGNSGAGIELYNNSLITGFNNIYATNIYENGYSVLTTNDTGDFASKANLISTGSNLQSQITSINNVTGTFVTTGFANATYATLVALNQKINWVSGQSQAFTNTVTTGVDTQSISFPTAFTGGTIPTVQVTLDIPSSSDYMYNVSVRNVTTSGFTALYSDTVLETGVVLNVWASKLYGSI